MKFNQDSFEDVVIDLCNDLQKILRHERKHFNFYLQACMEIKGMDRIYLKPFFEKEMMSELEHVRSFGDKLVAMGHKPTHESEGFHLGNNLGESATGRRILEEAIKMEREILEIYHSVYSKAEHYGTVFKDMSISLLLEENIEHTTADVEEMERILTVV